MATLTATLQAVIDIGGQVYNFGASYTAEDIVNSAAVDTDNKIGMNVVFTVEGSAYASDTRHLFSGVSFALVVPKEQAGITEVTMLGAAVSPTACLPSTLPFVMYHGDQYQGSINTDTAGTEIPDEEIQAVSVASIGGINSFNALAALKAVS